MPLANNNSYENIIASLQKNSPGYSNKFRAVNVVKDMVDKSSGSKKDSEFNPYENNYATTPIPKFRIPLTGTNPESAAQLIRDDLELDGKPSLNLASFVNTYADPIGYKLMVENLNKNMSDNDEYPALMNVHQRCINMIAHLWNVPKGCKAIGTSTTGSSEAIHLGGLAMKRRWEAQQKEKGKSISKPNILMGANAQVALEKFARYFDVEPRIIPVCEKSRYALDITKVRENLDENTIGVFVILGSTFTGTYEDVEGVSKILDDFEKESGNNVSIHVDGASGAFVAPFCHKDLVWDFRLSRVRSISTSGHKFGLTTAGLGWILWKDEKYLPENLCFVLKYLGGDERSFTLNFSRPGHTVVHQYYNLITLGYQGYAKVHGGSLYNARLLSKYLEATGYFECVSDIHRRKGVFKFNPDEIHEHDPKEDHSEYNPGLPVVAFTFSKKFRSEYPEIPQAAISTLLRVKGYIIPNYPLPPTSENIEVLRVVVRYTLSLDLLDKLMEDIASVMDHIIATAKSFRKNPNVVTPENEREKVYKALLTLVTTPNVEIETEEEWDGKPKPKVSRHGGIC